MTPEPVTDDRARVIGSGEVDTVARVLMAAWEQAEGKPVNVSYVATFADMARAILAHRAAPDHAPTTSPEAARDDQLDRVRALVESWPHGDNGQDYRRAVIQCRSAVLAALGEQP